MRENEAAQNALNVCAGGWRAFVYVIWGWVALNLLTFLNPSLGAQGVA